MPSYDTLTEIKAADVRTFDDDAKKLLAMMAMAKWRGYLSGSNHAIMHAPDGTTTISVSRDSLRGRSGRNARADFERWLRNEVASATEIVQEHDALAKSPFGDLTRSAPPMVDKGDWGWRNGAPIGLHKDAALEIKRDEEVCAWMNARTPSQRQEEGVLLYNEKTPRHWSLFDTRGWPSLVGHGSQTTPEEAYSRFLELDPDAFPGHQPAPADPEETTTDVATMYQCTEEGCGKAFESKAALKAHTIAMHASEPWICPECGREFRSAGTRALHEAGHNKEVCPECGDEIVPHFMTRHLDKHAKEAARKAAAEEAGKTHAEATIDAAIAHVKEPKAKATRAKPEPLPEPVPVSPDVTLTSGDDQLEQIRAIVSAPLLAENQALRARVSELERENAGLVKEREDAKARMALIMEAMQA